MKRIFQILPTIKQGDGISQEAIEIDKLLHRSGYYCRTYADSIIGKKLKKVVYHFSELPVTTDDDIILYHLSTGSHIAQRLLEIKGRLVICYHNITPAHWFVKYDKQMEVACAKGRMDLEILKERTEYCLADSQYNADELRKVGYKCPIKIFPVVLDLKRYCNKTGLGDNQKSSSGFHILFTGRIVPNKKVEDIIQTFYYIKKYYIKEASLDIVGNFHEDSLYCKLLFNYIRMLEVTDVVFHGHVTESKLISIYRKANIYLSLSEHEGFCIPLLEAMCFQIPVIAYNNGGVQQTLQNAGILLNQKDPLLIAGMVNHIKKDSNLRRQIIQEQNERIQQYGKMMESELNLDFILEKDI